VTAFEGTMLGEKSIGPLDHCENTAGQTGGLYGQAIFWWNCKEDDLSVEKEDSIAE
jgi:hypothetical protein